MLWRLGLFLTSGPLVFAGIWPEAFLGFNRVSAKRPEIPDRVLSEEYGLDQAEQAVYRKGTESFTATAWRLKDTTGATAFYQWQRPDKATPSNLEKLASETPVDAFLAFGNYVLRFDGRKPSAENLKPLLVFLPKLDLSALPPLLGYLPSASVIPNSERYILGPASLDRFLPEVAPSVAAFHLGSEAQVAQYRGKNGEMRLALFYYPTPQMARERLLEFQKIAGAMVKRSGPLLAMILSPNNLDDAERLLAQVTYKATITWSEPKPGTHERAVGSLLLSIFALCGLMLVFCVVAGIAVGGLRVLLRKWTGGGEADDPMTLLHLRDR